MSVSSGDRGVREQNPSFKRLVLKTRNNQKIENTWLDAITEALWYLLGSSCKNESAAVKKIQSIKGGYGSC